MEAFILILVVAVPLILWQIFSPKTQWQALESWKYKNPDANEPSDTNYGLRQIGGVISLIMLVVMGFMLYGLHQDTVAQEREREERTKSYDHEYPSYKPPEMRTVDVDLGPGSLVGYRYPSDYTLDLVVMEAERTGQHSCDTRVTVHEHSNAIVVEVAQSSFAVTWDDDPRGEPDLSKACDDVDEHPENASHTLQEPLNGRPIMTAAPLIDPTTVGLQYGSTSNPLHEVPEPGVYQPLTPVRISPSWTAVPLLAAPADTAAH